MTAHISNSESKVLQVLTALADSYAGNPSSSAEKQSSADPSSCSIAPRDPQERTTSSLSLGTGTFSSAARRDDLTKLMTGRPGFQFCCS